MDDVQKVACEKCRDDGSAHGIITDDAVERGCSYFYGADWGTWVGFQRDQRVRWMRDLLTAALATEERS